jgi:hypothetical protein
MPTVAENQWGVNVLLLSPTVVPFGVITVTPSDTDDLPKIARKITCTGAGNVNVIWLDDSTSIEAIDTTTGLKGFIKRVKLTSTTATGLKGYR